MNACARAHAHASTSECVQQGEGSQINVQNEPHRVPLVQPTNQRRDSAHNSPWGERRPTRAPESLHRPCPRAVQITARGRCVLARVAWSQGRVAAGVGTAVDKLELHTLLVAFQSPQARPPVLSRVILCDSTPRWGRSSRQVRACAVRARVCTACVQECRRSQLATARKWT